VGRHFWHRVIRVSYLLCRAPAPLFFRLPALKRGGISSYVNCRDTVLVWISVAAWRYVSSGSATFWATLPIALSATPPAARLRQHLLPAHLFLLWLTSALERSDCGAAARQHFLLSLPGRREGCQGTGRNADITALPGLHSTTGAPRAATRLARAARTTLPPPGLLPHLRQLHRRMFIYPSPGIVWWHCCFCGRFLRPLLSILYLPALLYCTENSCPLFST